MPDPIASSTILPQAFRLMEVTPPSSFDDASEQATAAKEQYNPALRIALESYDWSFARGVQALPALAALPAGEIADPDLPYAVSLPADFLILRKVYGEDCFNWRVDGRLLRSEQAGPVTIRYTRLIEREKYLPATFQLVVAYHLAVLLMNRFVKTRVKRNELKADLSDAVQAAQINDRHSARIGRIDGLPDSVDWVQEARRR